MKKLEVGDVVKIAGSYYGQITHIYKRKWVNIAVWKKWGRTRGHAIFPILKKDVQFIMKPYIRGV